MWHDIKARSRIIVCLQSYVIWFSWRLSTEGRAVLAQLYRPFEEAALTICFNQLPATNFTKGSKALTCWVHDVLMQEVRYKGQRRSEREILARSGNNIYYRPSPSVTVESTKSRTLTRYPRGWWRRRYPWDCL